MDTELYLLLAQLADRARRADVARSLAQRLRAADLLIFTRDPEIGVLLPALGFTQTLPGGRRWQSFLGECIRLGQHHDVLPYPTSEQQSTALGIASGHDAVLVLLNGNPEPSVLTRMCVLLPLLAATFHGERVAQAAVAHEATARLAAVQANALAASLDATRRELQSVVREARQLNEQLDQRVHERTEELNAANQQLRILADHLQSVREEEKLRVARELHDELGQQLTALKIDLRRLNRAVISLDVPTTTHDALRNEIDAMTELINNAIASMRTIVRDLRPAMLEDLGLVATAEWHTREFQQRTGITTHFSSNVESIGLDRERSMAMYRIMQESLTNVARHAEATEVNVSLRQLDGMLALDVRDNGIGFSHAQAPTNKSFGVLGMRERVQMLRGQFHVAGTPGQGTHVSVRIPL